MRVESWMPFICCGLSDASAFGYPADSPLNWLGGRSVFSFGHWPASDVGKRNCGYSVNDP
jgi:hypothetical protein